MQSRFHRSYVAIFALVLSACGGDDADKPVVVAAGELPTLRVSDPPLPLVLRADSTGAVHGTVTGDSLTVLRARTLTAPVSADAAEARLCGVIASGSGIPVELSWGWPVDSTLPRLATRVVSGRDLAGVRFVVPGADARYVYEGITRDGRQRVSVQWPVQADPARPVPVGAPDSVVEAALRPSVFAIDSTVQALTLAPSPSVAWPPSARPGGPTAANAVPDARVLPVHRLALSPACPEATVIIPMLARVDHSVKIPVDAGDVITADASVSDGTVRIQFDEAPAPTEPAGRVSVPHAAITATADGDLTLRVRVQVLPRFEAAQQMVYLRVQRTRSAR